MTEPIHPRLANDFGALFCGRHDAYGLGRGAVVREKLTLRHYLGHLQGEDSGIGVFPMLEDNTVNFGAIDLDEPNFELAKQLAELLPPPAWIERSRSGNAHLWVFFSRPAPAWAVRGRLKAALESVGRTDVEVFPKQDILRPTMLGNYINGPFHGDERPILWRSDSEVDLTPPGYTLEGFVTEALEDRQDPDRWVREARSLGCQPPEERPEGEAFGTRKQLHRCAEYIYERRDAHPVKPGHRHAVLFAMSKQLSNWAAITPARARAMVHEVNNAGVVPAPVQEVDRIFDTVLNGQYTSTGCDNPLVEQYIDPDCPIAGRG